MVTWINVINGQNFMYILHMATETCLPPKRASIGDLQRRFLCVLILTIVLCIVFPYMLTNDATLPQPKYTVHKRYITVWCDDGRRLGNLLFNYASLLGIAGRNNMTAVLPADFPVRELFIANMKMLTSSTMGMVLAHREYGRRACAYDVSTKHLPQIYDIRLYGYYQSWKYFDNVETELREHLTLLPEYKLKVREFFARTLPKSISKESVVKVGIHIRRGDQNKESSRRYGYTTASADYFLRAMDFVKNNITKSAKNVIFIVCTDDNEWTREHIVSNKNDVMIYSDTNDALLDFALLASCNHMIMSVGSFGWWAGWLTGGTVIYYKDWPRKYTRLEYDVNKKQYFPPHWIPL